MKKLTFRFFARAPKYEPQFQSLQTSEFDLIRLDASTKILIIKSTG